MLALGVLLFGFTLLFAAWVFARREGYYSTAVIFGVSSFLYYLSIPLEVTLTGANWIPSVNGIVLIEDDVAGRIAMLGALAYCCFVAGYAISGSKPVVSSVGPITSFFVPRSLVVLLLLSVLTLGIIFPTDIIASGTYAGHVITAYSSPVFSILVEFAYFSMSLIVGTRVGSRQCIGLAELLLIVPVLGWGVYSSDKDPLLVALLALSTGFLGKKSRSAIWLLTASAVALAFGTIGAAAFSQYRAGSLISMGTWIANVGLFRYSDPAGPMVSLVETIKGEIQRPELTRWLVSTFLLWIPKAIWPGRPLDLAEEFARSHISNWSPGQGMGFSLLAESYLLFGWLGPVFLYFPLGIAWGVVSRMAKRLFSHISPGYWHAVYVTFGFYLLIIMHRGTLAGIIKTPIQILVPLLLCSLVFDHRHAKNLTVSRK